MGEVHLGWPVVENDDGVKGESTSHLFKGEAVAAATSLVIGRKTKSRIRVRVVGPRSIGWLEAAKLWGANIEAMVVPGRRDIDQVKHIVSLLTNTATTMLQSALHLPPARDWRGIMLATLADHTDSKLAATLFDRRQPEVAIFAIPGRLSRTEVLVLLPDLPPRYSKTMFKPRHSNLGGVTTSVWHVIHVTQAPEMNTKPTLMKMESYSRTLQTALYDTRGAERCSFETRSDLGASIIGMARRTKWSTDELEDATSQNQPVYSSRHLGPDISTMDPKDLHFWVSSNSVMSKDKAKQVIRTKNIHELLAMWDYEGKLETKPWNKSDRKHVFRQRLLSPPGKIIQVFLSAAADGMLGEGKLLPRATGILANSPHVGLMSAVKFSPMEQRAAVRLHAAMSDDREVDLTTWAMPDETPEQTEAREVLRRFVFKWWTHYQERKAMEWLESADYTLPASSFVKSLRGDVDVSSMFMNFLAHYKERHALGCET
eukprot:CCRYP_000031-RA/>CCRYP_000031-RA protein AED:0.42 eAED:0.37 QI:0/0/0/1/1/1/2/0/485